jgi:signal transduction histidine kinase
MNECLVHAALEAVPALVWAILAEAAWRDSRSGRRSSTPRRFIAVSSLMALHYVLSVFQDLIPTDLDWRAPGLRDWLGTLDTASIVVGLAIFVHPGASFTFLREEPPPSRGWVATNYGVAALVVAVLLGARLVPDHVAWLAWFFSTIVSFTYFIVVTALVIDDMRRRVRRGAWRPGGLGATWSVDVAVAAGGLALLAVAGTLVLASFGGGLSAVARAALVLTHVGLGLAFAAIPAVRILGHVVRRFVLAVAAISVAGAIYFGAHALAAPLSPELRRLTDVAAVLALALVLSAGRRPLAAAIDRTLFGRGRRQAELQAFLHGISPELGALECCRRALGGISAVMGLRGVAIVLREGDAVAHGSFALEPIRRVWPRGAAADTLPATPFDADDLGDPVLREALVESEVIGVAPLASPRRRWGHLFATTGLLGTTFTDEDAQLVARFTDQLALILDGTDLLARAVAVERALAHAEKLAAIGELAARIAHEIRNPVTAARSLAQQLAREPDSPLNAEHAHLILTELERVERQIAALLRFARREEFRFEPVDVGELVRTTLGQLHPRLESAGIELALDAAGSVTTRADREKVRQVLINLVENAIDALGDAAGDRRLAIAVGRENGAAVIRVEDTGPGIPADALPRLFEPFFSLKTKGTGLGLAIAKRTIEAHGGTIDAASAPGGGATFRLELPLRGGADVDA